MAAPLVPDAAYADVRPRGEVQDLAGYPARTATNSALARPLLGATSVAQLDENLAAAGLVPGVILLAASIR
jgi:hypothetical protein